MCMESSWAGSQEPLAVCPWVCHLVSQHPHVLLDVSGLTTSASRISYFYKHKNEKVKAKVLLGLGC